jgi:hypothetical protein
MRDGSEPIERAADALQALLEDVGVDHRRLDVLVAQQFLHGADVVPGLEEMDGEAVTERVAPISRGCFL